MDTCPHRWQQTDRKARDQKLSKEFCARDTFNKRQPGAKANLFGKRTGALLVTTAALMLNNLRRTSNTTHTVSRKSRLASAGNSAGDGMASIFILCRAQDARREEAFQINTFVMRVLHEHLSPVTNG
jgi:hypothetical protein